MYDDYLIDPATGKPRTAAERAAYRDRLNHAQRVKESGAEQLSLDDLRAAAADARRMANKASRSGISMPGHRRNLKRLEQQADEFEQRVIDREAADARRKAAEADPAYQVAREHCEAFLRTSPDADRARTAAAILDAYDISGYWSEVRAIEEIEYARLDGKRSDAELNKLAADRDHAKAELASVEARQRLENLP